MVRASFAAALVGFAATSGMTAEPPRYPASVANTGAVLASFYRSTGSTTCAACDVNGGQMGTGSGRFQRLLDFLSYRPTIPCDRRPIPSQYVPPLHAWFPPCCHANDGSRGPAHDQPCAAGCGSVASRPVEMVAPRTPRPAPATMVNSVKPPAPAMPAALMRPISPPRSNWQPRPASNIPNGFRIEPSGYVTPRRS